MLRRIGGTRRKVERLSSVKLGVQQTDTFFNHLKKTGQFHKSPSLSGIFTTSSQG
jgi:hypothetical protein